VGKGRPGWHFEDTANHENYFGAQYDIHGGAMDLIFLTTRRDRPDAAASGKKRW